MATSPNYAWAEPDNSSLVKNGAADIRTLGDAIDTSVWNVGYGQAGKNKIINGDFSINQRAFTSTTGTGVYGFDRWFLTAVDGTSTYSAQTFTTGAAPVAGYESTNFARLVTTGQTLASAQTRLTQRIENVRTFAGQTMTLSFWAKAATGTPKIALETQQIFGTGGSPSAAVTTYSGQVTISTSWARYSLTVAVPSISGKTLGTDTNSSYLSYALFVSAGSDLNSRTGSLGIQSNTFDIWGVQAEYGSKATPFQLAGGGDPQSELAMCQRYYYRLGGNAAYELLGYGYSTNTTVGLCGVAVPVSMRVIPTTLEYSTLAFQETGGIFAVTSASFSSPSRQQIAVEATTAGLLTPGRGGRLLVNNSTSGYIAFSAEL
jgi:hypothetical protein